VIVNRAQGRAQVPKPLNAKRKTQKSQKKILRKTENATKGLKITQITQNAKRNFQKKNKFYSEINFHNSTVFHHLNVLYSILFHFSIKN
jgi:hypothetical protein